MHSSSLFQNSTLQLLQKKEALKTKLFSSFILKNVYLANQKTEKLSYLSSMIPYGFFSQFWIFELYFPGITSIYIFRHKQFLKLPKTPELLECFINLHLIPSREQFETSRNSIQKCYGLLPPGY